MAWPCRAAGHHRQLIAIYAHDKLSAAGWHMHRKRERAFNPASRGRGASGRNRRQIIMSLWRGPAVPQLCAELNGPAGGEAELCTMAENVVR